MPSEREIYFLFPSPTKAINKGEKVGGREKVVQIFFGEET